MQARKARGELVDEDARKRRERLKEILARQAELGVPVAELPAYYLSDRYGGSKDKNESGGGGRKDNNRNGKRRLNADQGSGTAAISDTKEKRSEPPLKQVKIEEPDPPTFVELAPTTREPEAGGPGELKIPKAEPTDEPDSEAVAANAGGKGQDSSKKYTQVCYFFKRGRCKKGNRCEFLHDKRSDRPKKTKKDLAAAANNKRQPSLLAKLLESDIRREKSHLLQSFRFFVNNMFLLEWPEKPLKFFDWTDVEDQAISENEVARIDKKLQEELEAVMEDTDEEEDDEEVGRVVTPREEEHGNGEPSMQLEAAQ
ncbi:hypothetical protein Mapa_016246 [Marchantia paleacea]|nr:hypothetical protein Mapa_016246 [Marchantia paleacea]